MAFDANDFDEQEFDDLIEAETPNEDEEDTPKKKIQAPVKKAQPIPMVPKKREPIIEELDEDEQPIELPKQKPVTRPVAPQQPQRRPQTQRGEPRFAPYIMPRRYGIMDSTTGQPYVEAADAESFTVALLADILNKLDKIEVSL